MKSRDFFFQKWIQSTQISTTLAIHQLAKGDIFSRGFEASAQTRYQLFALYPLEVMAILKCESTIETVDRVDMELFGFLYCQDDDADLTVNRQVKLLKAIDDWNSECNGSRSRYTIWQAYLKTWLQLTLNGYTIQQWL